MSKIVKILFAVSVCLLAGSGASFLIGRHVELSAPAIETTSLDIFATHAGDNWKYMAGAMLLAGLASALAAARIWVQDRRTNEQVTRIVDSGSV